MINDVTIIVNSCDKYSDLWYPFFELFRIQWANCPYEIILNTESKSYKHPYPVGKGIKCLHLYNDDINCDDWSTRLKKTLKYVKTKFCFMILDDEFIQKPVDDSRFNKILKLMKTDIFISYILFSSHWGGLVKNGTSSFRYKDFNIISISDYNFSCANAALWRTKKLKKYLCEGETPWQFELNCHQRCSIFDRRYRVKDGLSPIYVTYGEQLGIGIRKGKWLYKNRELFEKYGINVCFGQRGEEENRFNSFPAEDDFELSFKIRIDRLLEYYRENMPEGLHNVLRKVKTFLKNGKR